jgi:uncharacterized YigZ family protein
MTEIKDTYNSIVKVSEGIFKDKGSKFLSFAFPVTDEDEVKPILTGLKKKYHDARHHCYAYKIGLGDDSYRMNDDGEPSGTAGKPIFGQIVSHGLSDILIVVVRYFGGILLGTRGLINAYKSAAIMAIDNADLTTKRIQKQLHLKFTYEQLSIAMRMAKEFNLDIVKQDFTGTCNLILHVPLGAYASITAKFEAVYGIEVVQE